ncbi:uncharacterized protein LOC113228935 [Hyposmocoma kahamanoa]|uniref:uncharacterized protein LOC113228935 n=1 Tax=Hyposmocoma kahamanoa TaxID=1477025 RepID=UPI000E6D8DF7|nr:uncharacterized protein LOC113228935 [Hyposmocoma kahamanoa]
MSIFDPLGIATPVTIQAKRIIQDTWRSGIDWDTPLEAPEADAWSRWLEDVRRLAKIKVPRCYMKLSHARGIQLHTFVDASSTAYAAVTYWRVEDEDGNIHVSLIIGKGKVAPLKVISIPRLELQAAVLGCRLTQTVVDEHQFKPTSRYYWTDSRTVLTWIRNGPRVYKPFVAHRVAEIAEHTKTKEWRWIPTKMNVADDATRDVPHDFDSNHRWYRGPDFLYMSEENWPQEEVTDVNVTDEERVHLTTGVGARLKEALPVVTRFSSWIRLMRTTARVLQFIDRLRTRTQRCAALRKRTRKNADADPTWRKNNTGGNETTKREP